MQCLTEPNKSRGHREKTEQLLLSSVHRRTRSTEGGPQWDTPPWVTVPTTARTHARGAKASFCSLKASFYVKVCEPGQVIYPPCLRCPDFSSRILGTGKLLRFKPFQCHERLTCASCHCCEPQAKPGARSSLDAFRTQLGSRQATRSEVHSHLSYRHSRKASVARSS